MEIAGLVLSIISTIAAVVSLFLGSKATSKVKDCLSQVSKINSIMTGTGATSSQPVNNGPVSGGGAGAQGANAIYNLSACTFILQPSNVEKDVGDYVSSQPRRETANLVGIVSKALDQRGPSTQGSVDESWFAKYARAAADVTDQDLKDRWSSVLAGELSKKGSFSLRTISDLSNLSSEEAKLFDTFCNYLCNDTEVINEDAAKIPLTFEKIMVLIDCGLVKPVIGFLSDDVLLDPHEETGFRFAEYTVTVTNNQDSKADFSFGIYMLSTSGLELAKLPHRTEDIDYVKSFAKFIKGKNKNFDVHINKTKQIDSVAHIVDVLGDIEIPF